MSPVLEPDVLPFHFPAITGFQLYMTLVQLTSLLLAIVLIFRSMVDSSYIAVLL